MEEVFNVIQVPPKTSGSKILDISPVEVVLSNEPGDPKTYREVINTTHQIIEEKTQFIVKLEVL